MSNLGPNFYPKLVQISSELGMNPEDLLSVMVSESGIDPSAHEKQYGASGLVQMMPSTLKGLKFPGTGADFRTLSGEDQLDWVKKLVQGYAKMNGGPFTSAAQYYVGNFFPVALKLPGVHTGNPNTIFIEENPQTINIGNSQYSRKYYNVGIKLSPDTEKMAYKANPLFHGSIPGAITYGDMMKRVDKNKRNPLYSKALISMHQSTGYTPKQNAPSQFSTIPSAVKRPSVLQNYEQILNKYWQQITASDKSNKSLYNKLLPNHQILISIAANNHNEAVEFSRILSTALDSELLSTSYIHTDGNDVEIECSIAGPSIDCLDAVKQLSNSIADTFKVATHKLGGIEVKTKCIMNKKSFYQPISLKQADINYRTFLLKFI